MVFGGVIFFAQKGPSAGSGHELRGEK